MARSIAQKIRNLLRPILPSIAPKIKIPSRLKQPSIAQTIEISLIQKPEKKSHANAALLSVKEM